MNHFANRMAEFFSSGHSVPLAGRQSAPDLLERQSLSVSMWDEAVAVSMCDENTRTFLDHLGPRWK